MKVTPNVAQMVQDASAIARKRRHPELLPEHILAAMLGADEAWPFTMVPVCRPELARIVESRLAGLPAIGAYRDGAIEVVRSRETATLLAPRWSLIPHPIHPRKVLARLLELPHITALFTEALADLDTIDADLRAARERVATQEHVAVRMEHFLRVVTERRWFASALGFLGARTTVLAEVLDTRIATFVTRRAEEPQVSVTLERAAARAKHHAVWTARPASSDLLVAIAIEDAELRALLAEAEIPVDDLDRLLRSGRK